jgi:hypothetical protein
MSKKREEGELRTGWRSALARLSMGMLLFLSVTGFAITFLPFDPATQWSVVLHTVIGVVTLIPIVLYNVWHWQDYRTYPLSADLILGYTGTVAILVCSASGIVLTWQGFFEIATSGLWRSIHLVTAVLSVVSAVPHVVMIMVRKRRTEWRVPIRTYLIWSVVLAVVAIPMITVAAAVYSGTQYDNRFPDDYSYYYGEDRPFAPSLARTVSGGAYDARSLAGSESCGTAGCHEQIVAEWKPSAHRYAAMDTLFQLIQEVMAQQNGPESTRYCGGCHDPISLFSGTKNIFTEDLTNLHGYNEGVSCLVCHGIQQTDLQGNANYVITQTGDYLWQWHSEGAGRVARDFLIRTYPAEHNKLSKRVYKSPQYCAACHKQFIDEEINRVGWVQLQNQYDNWAASKWYTEGDPTTTIECRECHMPLVDSTDPAAGDPGDYNRTPHDNKHRSHRFIAANQFMPVVLDLEGWQEHVRLTESWLKGTFEIPEIKDKWVEGPIVQIGLETPDTVGAGEDFPIRVILTANKVGHDYPTGPLDIIQSWVEVQVKDERGRVVFSSGARDERNFLEPGSFLFKAEPVDQFGNLIDRHNLWEMVGVRYRRSLFPGYSDTVDYQIHRSAAMDGKSSVAGQGDQARDMTVPAPGGGGRYEITAGLYYRKVDQFLLNFFLGEDTEATAPAVEISRTTATVTVR